MSNTDRLELFVECPPAKMDDLLGMMRKLTKRPWMYWETHYNASFSPPDPSFDFARFEIAQAATLIESSQRTAKYLGQVRWIKQPDFNVLLAWETYIDGQDVPQVNNDFLIQDFYELILVPACEQLNLQPKIGAGIWQNRTK